jgi:hypothetical protein
MKSDLDPVKGIITGILVGAVLWALILIAIL